MRRIILFTLLACGPSALGQEATAADKLGARVSALEREVVELRNEIARLRQIEARVRALEHVVAMTEGTLPGPGDVAAPGSRPEILKYTAFDDLPYEEDRVLLVSDVREEGIEIPGGRTAWKLDVDLLDLPPAAAGRALATQVLGYRHLGFPEGFPAGTTRRRLVIENIGEAELVSWKESLAPESKTIGGRLTPLYKQIRFARIRTAQTNFGGYDGRSGSVLPWRGVLYWHENNVFFIEDGALRLIGPTATHFHLRFVRDESLAAAGG